MAENELPGPAVVTNDMRVELDVPYVEGLKSEPATRQALDVYAPRQGSELPVIVYVHGGGWKYWDRKGVDLKPAAFARKGFVFVSIGYRLVPEVRYRGQCEDVARGLRWIRDHIEVWVNEHYVVLLGALPVKQQRGVNFHVLHDKSGQRAPSRGTWVNKVELSYDGKLHPVTFRAAD